MMIREDKFLSVQVIHQNVNTGSAAAACNACVLFVVVCLLCKRVGG